MSRAIGKYRGLGGWPSATVVLMLLAAGCSSGASETTASPDGDSESASDAVSTDPAAPGPADAPRIFFRDVTDQVGLDFVHVNGMFGEFYLPEIIGAGGAIFDYDNDGDMDVYAVQGHTLEPGATLDPAHTDRLFRNELVETGELRFVDVTASSGLLSTGYGMGAATGDYDNDGYVDLYVTNWGSNQLWRNRRDGTFVDVTAETGTDDPRFSTSASFADLDQDGWLDLVVVNYDRFTAEINHPCYTSEMQRRTWCGPDAYPAQIDSVFRNRADGRFEDVSLSTGFAAVAGPGLGVVVADFDGDDRPDVFIANDGAENRLWINEGDWRFRDDGLLAGVALNQSGMTEASMGVVAADFDGDGDEDLFVTHLDDETNTLYRNLGGGVFVDDTSSTRLGGPSRPYTGFGTAAADFDRDGWLDLYVANGAVTFASTDDPADPYPIQQKDLLFANARGVFEDVSSTAGEWFGQEYVGRGAASGDLDNDGDVDLVVFNNKEPARVLLNESPPRGSWVGLRTVDPTGRIDLLGARVEVLRRGETPLFRRVAVDGSYASANDPRLIVGLGTSVLDAVRVRWPSGFSERWSALEVDRYHVLRRGQGEAESQP